jgi:hypothetical protein
MGKEKSSLHEFRHREQERSGKTSWLSGEVAESSGLYGVEHIEHPLNDEILIVKGTSLPFCSQCGKSIRFFLVKKIKHIHDDPDFPLT